MKNLVLYAVSAILLANFVSPAFAKEDRKGPGGKKHVERLFKHADKNEDGVVSKSEYIAHAETRFGRSDENGDGNLTKEEIKSHHKKMREKFENRRAEREAGDE